MLRLYPAPALVGVAIFISAIWNSTVYIVYPYNIIFSIQLYEYDTLRITVHIFKVGNILPVREKDSEPKTCEA